MADAKEELPATSSIERNPDDIVKDSIEGEIDSKGKEMNFSHLNSQ